jgi:hypothetical protein
LVCSCRKPVFFQPKPDSLEHRRESVNSDIGSVATSTRHILAPADRDRLEPPSRPFASSATNMSASPLLRSNSPVSLTVNYLPSKFSDAVLYNGLRRRNKAASTGPFPKRGGGVAAFRAGEDRVGAEGDDDYDGVQSSWFGGKQGPPKTRLRWNRFKWLLVVSNTLVSLCCSRPRPFSLCRTSSHLASSR